jgi:hypothetical protein
VVVRLIGIIIFVSIIRVICIISYIILIVKWSTFNIIDNIIILNISAFIDIFW